MNLFDMSDNELVICNVEINGHDRIYGLASSLAKKLISGESALNRERLPASNVHIYEAVLVKRLFRDPVVKKYTAKIKKRKILYREKVYYINLDPIVYIPTHQVGPIELLQVADVETNLIDAKKQAYSNLLERYEKERS